MDPNRVLQGIAELLRESAGTSQAARDAGEALDFACQDLFDWIAGGGFEPTNKAQHESAWTYYECRVIHHKRGERCEEGY